jgi:hypothetical protein
MNTILQPGYINRYFLRKKLFGFWFRISDTEPKRGVQRGTPSGLWRTFQKVRNKLALFKCCPDYLGNIFIEQDIPLKANRNVVSYYISLSLQIQTYPSVFYKKNCLIRLLPELHGVYIIYRTSILYTTNTQNNPCNSSKLTGLFFSASHYKWHSRTYITICLWSYEKGPPLRLFQEMVAKGGKVFLSDFGVFYNCGFKKIKFLCVYTIYIIYTVYIKR